MIIYTGAGVIVTTLFVSITTDWMWKIKSGTFYGDIIHGRL